MPAQATTSKKEYKRKGKKAKIPKKNLNKYQVKEVAKKVTQKMLNKNIETKHVLLSSPAPGPDPVTNLCTPLQLTVMTTGTGQNDILGAKCRLTSLWINYVLNIGDSTNIVRVIVFQDKMNNAVTPAFQGQLFTNGYVHPITSMYNTDLVPSRYHILYDRCIVLDTDDPQYCGHIRIKDFPKRTLEFQGGSPTIINAQAMGHLYFYVVSDSSLVTHPTIEYEVALFYKDA